MVNESVKAWKPVMLPTVNRLHQCYMRLLIQAKLRLTSGLNND
jgi:hypothetical protein